MRAIKMVTVSVSVVAIFSYTLHTRPLIALQTTAAQQQQPSLGQSPISSRLPDMNSKPDPESPIRERMEEQASKARNSERFKRIQTDTDKLLKLSMELKADVDKTTKNEMSLDVIRKAAEVEKLAHDVKERMKG